MDMYTKNHFGIPKRNFVISKGMFDLDKTTKLKNHENQKKLANWFEIPTDQIFEPRITPNNYATKIIKN
jgi:hypothetical protein